MMLRPNHRYEEIANRLREEIVRGSYGTAGRLPSERRLMRAFEVQRNTVRQALGLLEREGRVVTVSKSGWFVSNTETIPAPMLPPETISGRTILLVTLRHRAIPTFDTLAIGLYEKLAASGVSVLRYDSAPTEGTSSQLIETLESLTSVDAAGIVLWPQGPVDVRILSRLQETKPLILIDRRVFGFETDSVRFDDLAGGKMVTEYLIAKGHRQIAFLADEPFVETVQNRWRGYRLALEGANIPSEDRYTVLSMGGHEPSFSAGIRFLLNGLPTKPTAIVCSNDGVASKLMLFLRDEGLRVPEDIAVTGYGNEASGYLDLMGLTTVDQSFVDLGRAAGALLLERMAQPDSQSSRQNREIVLPVQLVRRTSA